MSEGSQLKGRLSFEKEMVFKVDLGKFNIDNLYIDERNIKKDEKIGPDPSSLLTLALLGCLSASFEFCLQKRKFDIEDLEAIGRLSYYRNERGFWRVKKIDIDIKPKITNPDALKRAQQCLKLVRGKPFFEQFCTVTESVRAGIEVNVNLEIQ